MFRGIDVGLTKGRLIGQAIGITFLVIIAIWGISVAAFSFLFPSRMGFSELRQARNSYFSSLKNWKKDKIIRNFFGKEETPEEIIVSSRIAEKVLKKWIIKSSLSSAFVSIPLSFWLIIGLWKWERKRMKGTLRGMERGEDNLKIKEKGRIIIPGPRGLFRIPYRFEYSGISILGCPRSGKTVCLSYLLKSILGRTLPGHKDKIILHDFKGDFTSFFYGASDVVLFSFTDRRRTKWNLLKDLFTFSYKPSVELGQIADSLIPPGAERDEEWRTGARNVLVGILLFIVHHTEKEKINNNCIKDFLNISGAELYQKLRKIPECKRYILELEGIEKGDRTASSYFKTLHPKLMKIFDILDDKGDYSITEFLEDPEKRVLLLQNTEELKTRTKPLIDIAFQIVIQKLLSREEAEFDKKLQIPREEYWLILDEFSELGYISSISSALTGGRSKGISTVIATQDFGNIKKNYGKDFISPLLNSSNILLSFRLNSPDDSSLVSRAFGENETTRLEETQTLGTSRFSDRLSLRNETSTKKTVTGSEIMALKDLEFFAKMPEYPISKYREKYFKFQVIAKGHEKDPNLPKIIPIPEGTTSQPLEESPKQAEKIKEDKEFEKIS